MNKIIIFACLILVLNISCAFNPSVQNIEPLSESAIRNLISSGIVARGMTKDQVLETWGDPYKIKQVDSECYDEIWFYKFNFKLDQKVYFKDNVMVK